MRLIDTKDAVGHMFGHDITQIIKEKRKVPYSEKVIYYSLIGCGYCFLCTYLYLGSK